MFGQTDIMLLVISCYRQMTKSSLFFQNWRIYLVSGEQTWKVVSFLLSASWMQAFAASMFDWNYYKCSVYIGNCISNFLMCKHYPGKNSLNLVPKTLKICGVHIGRNIKGMTKGWLPAAFTLGNAQKGRRGGYGRPFPDGFGDGFLSIDRMIFVRCCLQIMLNCSTVEVKM